MKWRLNFFSKAESKPVRFPRVTTVFRNLPMVSFYLPASAVCYPTAYSSLLKPSKFPSWGLSHVPVTHAQPPGLHGLLLSIKHSIQKSYFPDICQISVKLAALPHRFIVLGRATVTAGQATTFPSPPTLLSALCSTSKPWVQPTGQSFVNQVRIWRGQDSILPPMSLVRSNTLISTYYFLFSGHASEIHYSFGGQG